MQVSGTCVMAWQGGMVVGDCKHLGDTYHNGGT